MLFSIGKHFIRHNDNLYQVIRMYQENRIKSVEGLKEYYQADIALKNNGIMYFCIQIQEAEIIPEEEEKLISE